MTGSRIAGVFALVALGFGLAPGADTPAPKEEVVSEAVVKLRKAAKTAEVHAICLSGPRQYGLGKVTNLPDLVEKLRAKEKSPQVARVWDVLSNRAQKWVLDDKAFEGLSRRPGTPETTEGGQLRSWLTLDLRKMVDQRPDFYTEKAFKILPPDLQKLAALGEKRTAYQTAVLNWELLHLTFPDSIPELPKHFRTVRVQVIEGADIVLVLASGRDCRWEVKLLGGAKVTGVVLCGSGSATVVGVDAPVVYRCLRSPDGVTRDWEHITWPHENARAFRISREQVEELVDKKLASVTSGKKEHSYEPENDAPFLIRPGDKN